MLLAVMVWGKQCCKGSIVATVGGLWLAESIGRRKCQSNDENMIIVIESLSLCRNVAFGGKVVIFSYL